jgi:hypothetical protein
LSILKKISKLLILLLFVFTIGIVISLSFGVIVIEESGKISVPALDKTSPLPPDPNDPIIGAYLSSDDSAIYRFYGNGTYIFKSLIHPSASFGNWSNNGNNHYLLYLYSTESEGKVTYANFGLFSPAFGYELTNGVLASTDSNDRFNKISNNPDEVVQGHTYPTTSAETPINRQVGVDVKRVSPDSISIKIMTGKDVASLVSIRVMANGKEATMTSGKITPQIGSIAYYNVKDNTDIIVVAEFYDYSQYNLWAGMI